MDIKLPKISLVLPCYNMEVYIEDTLRSITQQNYPNFELIIMDGGSTDNTINIINKYKEYITVLISEPDNGQYSAITRGFEMATGDILCWLNADDVSFPWTFRTVAQIFSENREIQWLCGISAFLNDDGSLKKLYNNISAKPNKAIRNGWFKKGGYGYLLQETNFWTKELWQKSGGLDLSLKLAADYDLWINFAYHTDLWSVNLPLSAFRLRNTSRSLQFEEKYLNEVAQVTKNLKPLPLLFRLFGKKQTYNFFLRLITWRKTKLVYQPFNSNKWIYKEKYRSVSALTFSGLLLEIDSQDKTW
jgi:glycosyltransferase involved in cell wall biosynthesis